MASERWRVILFTISFFGFYLIFLTSMNIWKTQSIKFPEQIENIPQAPTYEEPLSVQPLPPIFSLEREPHLKKAPSNINSESDLQHSIPNVVIASQSENQINMSWSGVYACYDYGETFAASFLASSGTFLGMKKYRSVLKSHRAAHASHYLTWERQAHKTLDFLDFFVEHLSAYERRLNFGKLSSPKVSNEMKVESAKALSSRLDAYCQFHFRTKAAMLKENKHGLISIIPYYGEGMGKGQAQSSLDTRKAYIEATYWSVRAITPNVVIAVCTKKDAEFIEELATTRFAPALLEAGADPEPSVLTLLTFELQSPQSLPVGAVGFYVRTINKEQAPPHPWEYVSLPRRGGSAVVNSWTRHLQAVGDGTTSNVWQQNRHILFTEADQIIHARYLDELISSLSISSFMAPHRGVPMPSTSDFEHNLRMIELIDQVRNHPTLDVRPKAEGFSRLVDVLDLNQNVKNLVSVQVYPHPEILMSRCCMDAGNCSSRDHWKPYLDDQVALLRVRGDGPHVRGLGLVAGEGNVQHNPPTIRACVVSNTGQPCPS